MNTEETMRILKNIAELKDSKNPEDFLNPLSIYKAFEKAFNVDSDSTEFLFMRANLVQTLTLAKESYTDIDEDTKNIFDDIFSLLREHDLYKSIRDFEDNLTKGHISTIRAILQAYDLKHQNTEINDLDLYNTELKDIIDNEDFNEEEKSFLLNFHTDIKCAIDEYNIKKDKKSLTQLQNILIGKIVLNQSIFENINQKSKKVIDHLTKIYTKINEVNKIMGVALSVKKNTIGFLGLVEQILT